MVAFWRHALRRSNAPAALRATASISSASAGATRAHSKPAFALGLVDEKPLSAVAAPLNPFEVQPGCLLPGLPASEFQRRREKLFEVLPPNSALIVNAAETKYMTHDIPYEFRQSSNFLYLTGSEEPDAHAVLLKTKDKCSFVLFTRPRDAHSEQWDGARLGLDGAIQRFQADDAYQLTDLQPALHKILSGLEQIFVMSPEGGKYPAAFLEATKPFHEKFFAGSFFVEQLRLIKSEYELDRMRYAADIGAGGFIDMMKNTRAGMTELALASYFESSCKHNGALWNSFPNVVGSGANAAIIHYLSKRSLLSENELVLVDSGCEVAGGYVSDITRTWPVGGKLSQAQRDLYEFTLDVQKQCLAHLNHQIATKQSISLDQLHDFSVKIMVDGMQQFGILKSGGASKGFNRSVLSEFQKYNPTHIGHYLGMDVHDTPHITRGAALQPGMVITVEPGVYLPQHDQQLPHEFRGIGIRIEDDVILATTAFGPSRRAASCDLPALGRFEHAQQVHGRRPDERDSEIRDSDRTHEPALAAVALELLGLGLLARQQRQEEQRHELHAVADADRDCHVAAHLVRVPHDVVQPDLEARVDDLGGRASKGAREVGRGPRLDELHDDVVGHDEAHALGDVADDRHAEPEPLVAHDVPGREHGHERVDDHAEDDRDGDTDAPVPAQAELAREPQGRSVHERAEDRHDARVEGRGVHPVELDVARRHDVEVVKHAREELVRGELVYGALLDDLPEAAHVHAEALLRHSRFVDEQPRDRDERQAETAERQHHLGERQREVELAAVLLAVERNRDHETAECAERHAYHVDRRLDLAPSRQRLALSVLHDHRVRRHLGDQVPERGEHHRHDVLPGGIRSALVDGVALGVGPVLRVAEVHRWVAKVRRGDVEPRHVEEHDAAERPAEHHVRTPAVAEDREAVRNDPEKDLERPGQLHEQRRGHDRRALGVQVALEHGVDHAGQHAADEPHDGKLREQSDRVPREQIQRLAATQRAILKLCGWLLGIGVSRFAVNGGAQRAQQRLAFVVLQLSAHFSSWCVVALERSECAASSAKGSLSRRKPQHKSPNEETGSPSVMPACLSVCLLQTSNGRSITQGHALALEHTRRGYKSRFRDHQQMLQFVCSGIASSTKMKEPGKQAAMHKQSPVGQTTDRVT